jgi:two-component system cell cycle response regulator DivK
MTETILLVEDNELNRDMLKRRLSRAGYTVITAGDGQQALDQLRATSPHVVLLDMNLPVKDGWTTCSEIRQDPAIADTPIIALTAHAMSADRDKAMAAGCDDYATKPIDFPDLLEKIAGVSRGRSKPE